MADERGVLMMSASLRPGRGGREHEALDLPRNQHTGSPRRRPKPTMPAMSSARPLDLVIVGSTAPGLFAAMRAAHEGLAVAVVTEHRHLGGEFPSLGAVESHYAGNRAPLLAEFVERVVAHYTAHPGPGGENLRICLGGGKASGGLATFEPHVAEKVLADMLAAAPPLEFHQATRILAIEAAGGLVQTVRCRREDGSEFLLRASAWMDATSEGDFLAPAGAPFRIGRESRAEFGEPNAGKVFSRWVPGCFPRAAAEGRLNLQVKGATTEGPQPGSTGEGDDNIQSYSYRLCLSDDPGNRLIPTDAPAGYERARYAPLLLPPVEKQRLGLPFHHRWLNTTLEDMAASDHLFHGHPLPNRKRSWNATNLTGAGKRYALAAPEERRAIERAHLDHALGLLWFLQNDDAVPAGLRARAREWGLARDEFTASGNLPPVMYVREARRLHGRAVFTEHDAREAPPLPRAPLHPDSVGITDFSLDSLACTTESRPGTLCDGQLFQMEVSRPAQVPWGVLLPPNHENLIVVNTVSATHVGWGAIRQTPALMHLAESAAHAVVLAAARRVPPARLPVLALQRRLVSRGIMLSFFNDFDMAEAAPWVTAVQLLAPRGFFPTYDARPHDPLTAPVAALWARATRCLAAGNPEAPDVLARELLAAEGVAGPPVTAADFATRLGDQEPQPETPLDRGTAAALCVRTWEARRPD